MREGWTETTIGAVTEVNPETTTGWSPDTSFRYIDLSSVSADRGIDEAGLPTVALVNAPRRARRVVRRGDVIVATVRPYLRGFAQVPTSLDGEVASTGFCVLRAVNQVVESRYIWAAVRTPEFVAHIMARATGSNYPAVRSADIASFPIILPPLAEQRRIVDLIGSVDQALTAAQDAQQQARACQLALGESSWLGTEYAALGDLGDTATGRTPSTRDSEYWIPPSVPFVTPGDLGAGLFIDNPTRQISRRGADKARLLPPATVLHVCIGATIGKVGVLRRIGTCNQQINALVGLDQTEAVFVGTVLGAPSGVSRTRSAAGQTTMPLLKKSAWVQLEIPWPERSSRLQVGGMAQALEDVAVGASVALERLETLRRELLSDLLSGDQEIPASYDELLSA
jgi:type I restriction enzyme S subunit